MDSLGKPTQKKTGKDSTVTNLNTTSWRSTLKTAGNSLVQGAKDLAKTVGNAGQQGNESLSRGKTGPSYGTLGNK